MSILEAIGMSIIGILLVFFVLVILIVFIRIMSAVVHRADGKGTAQQGNSGEHR